MKRGMYIAEQLAEFTLTARPLSPVVREACARAVFDLMTATIAGLNTTGAVGARTAARNSWGQGSSACWFTNLKLTPPGAAFANSAAASMLDLDDGHRAAAGHPGAAVIPAVFAEADRRAYDDERLFHAIALGYEIGIRVSAARDFKSLSTMATGLWCGQGVAASIGFLRSLTSPRLAHAISICGTVAPVLAPVGYTRFMGNSVKEAIPFATASGINAVDLSQTDYTGPLDFLDHSDFDRAVLIDGLGVSWAIESVYFKEYSCCRWAHAPIDAMLALQKRSGFSIDEIEAIDIDTFGRSLTLNNEVAPHSLESAQYSLPFCVALAAVRGPEALLPMLDDVLADARVLSLARRVRLHLDAPFDAMFSASVPGRVTLTARGQRVSETVLAPRGEPTNPMSWQDLERKFLIATGRTIDESTAEEILSAARAVRSGDFRPLAAILRQPLRQAPRGAGAQAAAAIG
jgi:2-methylcitrate dehydratase PrpD